MAREYFCGKYEEYYNSLSGEGEKTTTVSSFASEVNSLVNEFTNVKNIMAYWSGEAASAMSTDTINSIMEKFTTAEENIQDELLPCCEAVDGLVESMTLMKEKEDEYILKQEELEDTKSKDVPQYVKQDQTKYRTNEKGKKESYIDSVDVPNEPEYSNWLQQIKTLENEILKLKEELDELKLSCDAYISSIESLESQLKEFTNYMSLTNTILGLDNTSDFSKYTLEERLKYLQDIIDNYNEIYNSLNTFYEQKYGQGFEFTKEDFKNLDILFDTFDLYYMSQVARDKLVKSSSGDMVLFDIDNLTKIINYCNSNDVFTKIESYMNGASWEDSGLEKLYGGFFDTDSANFLNFNGYNEEKLKQRLKENYGVEGDPREFIKKHYNEMVNSYSSLMNSYGEYNQLVSTMAVVKSKINDIKQAQKLMPFEIQMENPDFQEYLNKDYSGYFWLNEEKLSVMTKEEIALYDYLRNTKSNKEAKAYLDAMENAMNQRIGAARAADYIEYLRQGGYGIDDLLASGFEGTKDGVRNFFDGIADIFRVANTEEGTKSALDYEMMYKAQYMQELMNDVSYVNPNASEHGLLDLTNWYNTGTSIGNMVVPSLVSFVPVVGSPLSSALMTVSIAGNSAVEAKQEGYSTAQAYLYGGITGASEILTEKVLGGIPGISNLEDKGFLGAIVGEGLEEFTQEYLDTGVRWGILGEKPTMSAKELFNQASKAGIQGAITSGIMQGGNAAIVGGLNTVTRTASSVAIDATGTTARKYNSFAEFKMTKESEFYTPRAESAVREAVNKVNNGQDLTFSEKVKLNRALSNVSSEELSHITSSLDNNQTTALKKAAEGVPILSKSGQGKLDVAETFSKVENAEGSLSSVKEIANEDILKEKVTRDGRTMAEYIADYKSNAVDSQTKAMIKEASPKIEKAIEARIKKNSEMYGTREVSESEAKEKVTNWLNQGRQTTNVESAESQVSSSNNVEGRITDAVTVQEASQSESVRSNTSTQSINQVRETTNVESVERQNSQPSSTDAVIAVQETSQNEGIDSSVKSQANLATSMQFAQTNGAQSTLTSTASSIAALGAMTPLMTSQVETTNNTVANNVSENINQTTRVKNESRLTTETRESIVKSDANLDTSTLDGNVERAETTIEVDQSLLDSSLTPEGNLEVAQREWKAAGGYTNDLVSEKYSINEDKAKISKRNYEKYLKELKRDMKKNKKLYGIKTDNYEAANFQKLKEKLDLEYQRLIYLSGGEVDFSTIKQYLDSIVKANFDDIDSLFTEGWTSNVNYRDRILSIIGQKTQKYGWDQGYFRNVDLTEENQRVLIDKMKKKYNFKNEDDVYHFMELIDRAGGACAYTEHLQQFLFNYVDKSEEFKRLTGIDLFTEKNGTLNYNHEIFLDFYIHSNLETFCDVDPVTHQLSLKSNLDDVIKTIEKYGKDKKTLKAETQQKFEIADEKTKAKVNRKYIKTMEKLVSEFSSNVNKALVKNNIHQNYLSFLRRSTNEGVYKLDEVNNFFKELGIDKELKLVDTKTFTDFYYGYFAQVVNPSKVAEYVKKQLQSGYMLSLSGYDGTSYYRMTYPLAERINSLSKEIKNGKVIDKMADYRKIKKNNFIHRLRRNTGHATSITGITPNGELIVSTWADRGFIPIKELKNFRIVSLKLE